MQDLCVAELQQLLGEVVPQLQRLEGLVSVAAGQLQARTGGTVPTPEGGSRSVAGWLAQQCREAPSAAGSQLRTSALLRSLPLVAAAVLDGVLTQAQAAVLSGWSARSTRRRWPRPSRTWSRSPPAATRTSWPHTCAA